MNSTEILVVAGCLLIGYVFISRLMSTFDAPGSKQTESERNHSQPDDSDDKFSTENDMNGLSVLACYKTLGVAAGARPDEIRLAYKRMMAQYHPDKVNDLGEKIRLTAEAESKRINQAYDYLKLRGYAN